MIRLRNNPAPSNISHSGRYGVRRTLQALLTITLMSLPLGLNQLQIAVGQSNPPTLRQMAEKRGFYIGTVGSPQVLASNPLIPEMIAQQFNLFVPENEAKLCFLQPLEGRYNFSPLDKLYSFAEKNNMTLRGHVLVWHDCIPNWLKAKTPSRDEAIALLRDHILTTVGRYRGRIKFWDVVNEAFNESGTRRASLWQKWIGNDYIELAFKYAHEADPDALLFYNDYNAETINAKSDAIYAMVKGFKERHIPIDGVGLQAHFKLGEVGPGLVTDPAQISANMARLGALGLQAQITEMDVAHLGKLTEDLAQLQAGTYYQIIQTCLAAKNCTAFTVWGLSDATTWLRMPEYSDNPVNAPLLFDENVQPKPAFNAVLDALSRAAGAPPILTDAEVAAFTTVPKPAVEPLPEPKKSVATQLAPDSVNGQAYYAAFPVTIKLDGNIDDWANIPRDTLNSTIMQPKGDSTAMSFAVAADKDNIYFLAEVTDSNVVFGTNDLSTGWYMEDSPEFYINATGDLSLQGYQPGVVQLAIPAANIESPKKLLTAGGNSTTITAQGIVVKTDTGYRVEAALPLVTKVWSIVPTQGLTIGFQAHLNGSSGKGRDVKLIWSAADIQDKSYANPSLFGRLIFWKS